MELSHGDLASIKGLYSCGKGCHPGEGLSEKLRVWDIPEDASAGRLLGHSLVAFAYQPCAVVGQQAFLSVAGGTDESTFRSQLPSTGSACSSDITVRRGASEHWLCGARLCAQCLHLPVSGTEQLLESYRFSSDSPLGL